MSFDKSVEIGTYKMQRYRDRSFAAPRGDYSWMSYTLPCPDLSMQG
jgi:hypothetical protein